MKENKNPILAGAESAFAFEEAMKEYIAELEANGAIISIPASGTRFSTASVRLKPVSRSYFTLRRLHNRFGKGAVEGWLKNHFDNK
jgi:hypothetical protein